MDKRIRLSLREEKAKSSETTDATRSLVTKSPSTQETACTVSENLCEESVWLNSFCFHITLKRKNPQQTLKRKCSMVTSHQRNANNNNWMVLFSLLQ